MDQVPTTLSDAVTELWRLSPPAPANLFRAPSFEHLRGLCQQLYENAGSGIGLTFALGNALRALGLPCGLTLRNAEFAIPPEAAAAELHTAFCRTNARRVHLCPLDCSDSLPILKFGPNFIRQMSTADLEAVVQPARLSRINPDWIFDARRFSEFTWLVVEETVPVDGEPGKRAVPGLYEVMTRDYGAIEPHQRATPVAVEAALFAVMLAPWEQWAEYRDLDWRLFRIPWVYTVDDDIFRRPVAPPLADSLSWEEAVGVDGQGHQIEFDRPTTLPASKDIRELSQWLNEGAWIDVQRAHESPLLVNPVVHFLVRGFQATGIDEFLAHITVVEAAFGMGIDHHAGRRGRIPGHNNPGATARVSARLSAALSSNAAREDFRRLFDLRSEFLHGREMSTISSADRALARSLARKAAASLIRDANNGAATTREAYLSGLLSAGFAKE
jgi:hypothetical protein